MSEKPPKKPRKKANRRGSSINFYIQADLDAAMRAFIDKQLVDTKQSAVITKSLRLFLEQQGFFPPKENES